MSADNDFDIPDTGAVFTFGKSRFADNAPSKFWIKNDSIVHISCGDEHTAVITESGRVFMIGSNDMGQLGLGSTKPVNKPSCVKALKPEKALHIACGRSHTIAACASGAVYTWGHNGDGQLGVGSHDDHHSPVLAIKFEYSPTSVSAGSAHSAVLTDGGEVYIWGGNSEGQLGLDVGEQLTPVLLTVTEPIADIACGYYHTAAVSVSGRAYTWGESDHGQLGLTENQLPFHRHPQLVPLPAKVVQVAAGSAHTLFLEESGGVYSCGSGSNGELGQGGGQLESSELQPVVETNTHAIVSIAAGDNHSAAITDNGFLLTWGCGCHGKLCQGEENFASQFVPVVVRRLRHITVILVDCGGCHTMVLGYRRPETEDSQEDEENTEALHLSLSSAARVRRRITDGILPPLKSVGLPPVKPTVLPTVPDTEDALREHQEDTSILSEDPHAVIPDPSVEDIVNGVNSSENSAEDESDDEDNAEEQEAEKPPTVERKGRFARFFGGLGKKKSTSLQTLSSGGEDPASNSHEIDDATYKSANHPVEEDTHLESIEDQHNDGTEVRDMEVMEAFIAPAEDNTFSSSLGKPGHKQSKACVIL